MHSSDRDDKKIIWVVGCPKCGNTWLSRLVGEAIDAPVGGTWHQTRNMWKQPACAEGSDRISDHWIYQEHLYDPSVAKNDKTIFINRDPRDVIVATKFYWATNSISAAIEKMALKWASMLNLWYPDTATACTSYEALLNDTSSELSFLLSGIGVTPVKDIDEVVHNQSFAQRSQFVENNRDNLHLGYRIQKSLVRKGIVGDWRNHLSVADAKKIHELLYPQMKSLGYETNEEWWKLESVPT